jgi:type I restriction enzyme S subunit
VRAPIGALNYAKEECCIGRGLAGLTPDTSKVASEFVFWMLKGKKAELNSKGTGSTFKAIGRKVLEETLVPNIGLDKQKVCSEHLEQIYRIIQARKQELQLLEDLIRARFVEMFGDPITNSKELPREKMDKRYLLKAGITTSSDDIHEYIERKYEVPCYGGNGVRGYVEEFSYEGEYPIIGRQGALCGNVQYASGKFHATEHAVLVSVLKDDNTIWAYYMLRFMDLYRYHTGAAQPGLAVKTLNTVDVIIAEKDLQNQFADFVTQVDKSKLLQKRP